jgi:hypothetical protein
MKLLKKLSRVYEEESDDTIPEQGLQKVVGERTKWYVLQVITRIDLLYNNKKDIVSDLKKIFDCSGSTLSGIDMFNAIRNKSGLISFLERQIKNITTMRQYELCKSLNDKPKKTIDGAICIIDVDRMDIDTPKKVYDLFKVLFPGKTFPKPLKLPTADKLRKYDIDLTSPISLIDLLNKIERVSRYNMKVEKYECNLIKIALT